LSPVFLVTVLLAAAFTGDDGAAYQTAHRVALARKNGSSGAGDEVGTRQPAGQRGRRPMPAGIGRR
jgi:hypothetical protein